MKSFFISVGLIFLFNGCGDTSSSEKLPLDVYIEDDNSSEPTQLDTTRDFGGIYYQQWYMEKDDSFYSSNEINDDAHIHPQEDTYYKYTGKGVKVAIIDNGFDLNHPEFKEKIIASVAFDENGNELGSDVSHEYGEYHGTAVTGIIASSDDETGTRGIAPDVELILIKMPVSFSEDVEIKLFEKAVALGADIINCSWGTYNVSDGVVDYINEISNTARGGKGVVVVFASGNDDSDINNDESSIPSVISVGATDKDNYRTSYSNYGDNLDIVAPGGEYLNITTTDVSGSEGAQVGDYIEFDDVELYRREEYLNFVGTSASAPIVSGIIALALEKNPTVTNTQLQELVKVSTDTIGLNTPYLDDMIVSNSQNPTITGLLGTSGNTAFGVELIAHTTNTIYGPYDVFANEDNTFLSEITDSLDEGFYDVVLVSEDVNNTTIYALDNSFEINKNKETQTNPTIRKSTFYGYGKINLGKLLDNI